MKPGLKKYFSQIGQKGGRVKSEAKSRAARENGLKGVEARKFNKEKKWLDEIQTRSKVLTKLRHEDMTEEEILKEDGEEQQQLQDYAYERENGKGDI